MKNILITGGGGFIGSHVAKYYIQKSYIEKVIIIDNLSRDFLLKREKINTSYNIDYLQKYDKIKFHQKDIRNFDFLKSIFKENEIDIIIHTAAQTAVTTSIVNPFPDFENNVIGTFNILEAARLSESDPVMILCSTNKVFGDNINKCKIIEEDQRYKFSEEFANGISEDFPIDLCEHTLYSTSKLCSDLYFQEYGQLYGMKTGIFRMSCVYGKRQFGVEDQGWVAHFVISALTEKTINIFGDGKQVRDLLYVSDLIDAYNAFIEKVDKIKHSVFCMGGGKENTLSLLELIELLKEETGKDIKFEFFNWRPSDQKVYISDIRKAKDSLNWSPKVNPKEGVKKLIKWTQNNITLFK